MKVEDVKPGMKGYGLTVMSGTKPERFDVEVVSTLHNFRPGQDLFLVKTHHPRLEVARTVAGMSGSPIFIDGKMIGAYAYGWMFGVEPIAGVTPIHSMLDDLKRPVPKVLIPGLATGTPLPRGGDKHGAREAVNEHRFASRQPLDYDLKSHAAQIAAHVGPKLSAPAGASLRPASTDVMVGGLGPKAVSLARELLEPLGLVPLQTGGGGGAKLPGEVPTGFEDGGVINVELVRGDISMAGLGTVTHVVGDKLVAFGHPMIGGGIEALPTALGYVHWILATENRSFKIGEPIKPLGTLINDRQASIVVDTTMQAPVFPVSIDIRGGLVSPDTKTRWNMEVSHDPFFAPSFVTIALGSALETTTAERNDLTWRAKSKVVVKGHGTLEFEDFGAGNGSPMGPGDVARTKMIRAVGALVNNPWKVAQFERIDMTVDVVHERDVLFVRGATVVEPEIDAGQPARVRLTLLPYQGQMVEREIEIPIPASLAGKDVRIKLEPGYRVARTVAMPETFEDLVDVLPKLDFPSETIVASFAIPDEATAAFAGHVANRLPPGAVDTLRPTNTSVAPIFYNATEYVTLPIDGFLIGQDSVTVKVREVVR
ncbi:MAG: SpoIVB peptidase S55 domain-containing protein [Polyangiaceae bacterium]